MSPPTFHQAVDALLAVRPRAELRLVDIDPPRRLAPHSFALGVELADDVADALVAGGLPVDVTGRLVLLHDPTAHATWRGTFRIVSYLRAPLDPEQAEDPLLLEVSWSWLTDALEHCAAGYAALGGTVTRTSSARFGEIAGPTRGDDVELRASWTPTDFEFGRHAEVFYLLLTHAIGLPEVGVSSMTDRHY
ncbi:MAG: DUF3000 domain-containing protein [Pseudonocardia sp.]|nr:DUF3000 domain-containing protein [Pseudonocardia sp.]